MLTHNYSNMTPSSVALLHGEGRQTFFYRRLLGSLVGVAGVDQRGEQQELWRLVQQDEIVASQAVVVHPAAADLEGC